tara:strand:+ start:1868 stop:2029 length:162 start_codon:yes stop_codon:yes gene_type:complete
MWGIFLLGFAVGIIFCEVCEFCVKKSNESLKKIENELLVGELNKLKEQIEKQN